MGRPVNLTLSEEHLDSVVLARRFRDVLPFPVTNEHVRSCPNGELDQAKVLPSCRLVKESGPGCVVQVRQVYQANARCLKKRYEGSRRRRIRAREDVGAEDGAIGGVEKGARICTSLDLADDA
jgi:hypothetical protein